MLFFHSGDIHFAEIHLPVCARARVFESPWIASLALSLSLSEVLLISLQIALLLVDEECLYVND